MGFPLHPVVLIDDAAYAVNAYVSQLRDGGISNVVSFFNGEDALQYLRKNSCSLVLLDLSLPGISGEEVLAEASASYPQTPVIIVTASEDTESVVRCMKGGAFDYLVKPVASTRLLTAIKRALEYASLKEENKIISQTLFSDSLSKPESFADIITRNQEMKAIFKYIEAVAQSSQPVFITGDTGTGKEMLAKSVHLSSGRKGEFVAVNVAGLDDNMFSDTLFGHVRGSFTGADSKRSGLIEKAAAGTIFLDEIGDLNASCQVKLLRLIQEHEYYPLGSDIPKYSDARIVLATNRNINELKNSPNFRNDLFYRICAHHINLPPLRERMDDIPPLVMSMVKAACKDFGKSEFPISNRSFALISSYDYPGNIRELKSLVFDAVGISHGEAEFVDYFMKKFKRHPAAEVAHQGAAIQPGKTPETLLEPPTSENIFSLLADLPTLDKCEVLLINEAMRRCGGNRTAASAMLGTTRQLLHRRLKLEK